MISLESLAVRMHEARAVVVGLRKQMAALRCEHELAMEIATHYVDYVGQMRDREGRKYDPLCDDAKPCWKGTMEDLGDSWGRKEFLPFGENRDGGWCEPCTAREKLRAPLTTAKLRLAGLMSHFWRAAARLAKEQGGRA